MIVLLEETAREKHIREMQEEVYNMKVDLYKRTLENEMEQRIMILKGKARIELRNYEMKNLF